MKELKQGMETRGIGQERIEIRNQIDGDSYLKVYDEIDIALDVFPWAGGTTTLEALWMGVPVIAYWGDRRSARSTAMIVENVGCAELVARSESEYVALSLQLSRDHERLKTYRSELRSMVTETVANHARFTKTLESTFRELWGRWCDQPAA